MMINTDEMATEAEEVAAACGKLLEGRLLAVQGAALVDLYSTFLSVMSFEERLQEMQIHGRMVLELARVKAEERMYDAQAGETHKRI